ncbi:MAG: WYL domain-containing protein [gamma proteobacterium symbiont of Bathyaustriella thionipta]|nr:WYL domain-containing protein [gamma proteobacterium symbiont of Bathyaustriella thionipta]MCU7950191.1 WYL domain-containing protein [gamma proteobacterium symbiont of Bathyaustriella thionipta]MCU7954926.1 WYL domain-containing protein [gamma proteobacterium symbiont of Bathyaustriella thionipta]MCU7958041.1 WYL domain-containing protein [gamma proteobacterium symbiont of Bathyaustriella thionipta]MCU7967188.1 WYL domain-containing protein [gamma proteobacterium symbiont of Bathyaustriella
MAQSDIENQWPLRWDLLLRYRLIEIIALWEGRLTTTTLIKAFGIGRQQASKDINCYIRDVSQTNLEYDKHLKGYKPTKDYHPQLTKGTVNEYLHMLNSRRDLSSHLSYLTVEQANTEVIYPPNRHVKAEFIRPVIKASREQQRIEIDYLSITSDGMETRVITPHTLVFSGYRWHIRAHCDKHNDYRDFVLSRISNFPEPVTNSKHGVQQDIAWNTQITLKITPNPQLSPFQQNIISREYGMLNGVLKIITRAALASYHLHYLRITPEQQTTSPMAQQLVLDNHTEIKPWLF